MRIQKGLSFYSTVFVVLLIGFAGYFGFRAAPMYMDNFTIAGILQKISELPDAGSMTEYELRLRFQQMLDIDNVRDITSRDLRINRIAIGYVLSVPREQRVDLFYNLDLVATFDNSITIER